MRSSARARPFRGSCVRCTMPQRRARVALQGASAAIFIRNSSSNSWIANVLHNFAYRGAVWPPAMHQIRALLPDSGPNLPRRHRPLHWFSYCSKNCQAALEDNTCIGRRI